MSGEHEIELEIPEQAAAYLSWLARSVGMTEEELASELLTAEILRIQIGRPR